MGKHYYYLHVCTVPLDGSGPTSSDDLDVLPKELNMKALLIKSKYYKIISFKLNYLFHDLFNDLFYYLFSYLFNHLF